VGVLAVVLAATRSCRSPRDGGVASADDFERLPLYPIMKGSSPAWTGGGVQVREGVRRRTDMSLPKILSREEWTDARVELLEQEKALTKACDALAAERRRLPMVEVTEDYRFTASDGSSRTLLDLFEGRHQLIVDHYMFDPDWEEAAREMRFEVGARTYRS
jgi:hypothetical protein